MSDWFIENFGVRNQIIIIGADKIFEHGNIFATSVFSVIHGSAKSAVRNALLYGDKTGVVEAMGMTTIVIELENDS